MDTREWVKMWQRTGKLLEEIKARELRDIDTAAAIRSFEGLDVEARRLYPPEPTSGLVEMQRLFRKLRNR